MVLENDGSFYKLFSKVRYLYQKSCGTIIIIILFAATGISYNLWNSQLLNYNFFFPERTVRLYGNSTFVTNWNRLMSARTDWQSILSSCANNIEYVYENTLPGWGKQNKTSANKSIVISIDGRSAGEFSTIWIQTRTEDGRAKTIGGDYWRIIFTGPASISATVFDHKNGSYEAIALFMEPGIYKIHIFLEYTLCRGLKDPPEHWFRAGESSIDKK